MLLKFNVITQTIRLDTYPGNAQAILDFCILSNQVAISNVGVKVSVRAQHEKIDKSRRQILYLTLELSIMIIAIDSPQLDEAFEALKHAKRRRMLHSLAFRPTTVGQLADEHQLSLPAMHKHIRSLERGDLILRKKVGRTNAVVLNRKGLKTVQDWMSQYETHWGNDKETLDNYITSLEFREHSPRQ